MHRRDEEKKKMSTDVIRGNGENYYAKENFLRLQLLGSENDLCMCLYYTGLTY